MALLFAGTGFDRLAKAHPAKPCGLAGADVPRLSGGKGLTLVLRSHTPRCHLAGAPTPFRTAWNADASTCLAACQQLDPLDQDPTFAHPVRDERASGPRRLWSYRSPGARALGWIRARRVDVAARFSHPFAHSPPPLRVNGSTVCTGLDHTRASLAAHPRAIEMRSTDLCHTHPVKDRVIPEGSKLTGHTGRNPERPFRPAAGCPASRAARRARLRRHRSTDVSPRGDRDACVSRVPDPRFRAEARRRVTIHPQASVSPASACKSPESSCTRETGRGSLRRFVKSGSENRMPSVARRPDAREGLLPHTHLAGHLMRARRPEPGEPTPW